MSPLTGVFVEAGQLAEAPVAGGAPVGPLARVGPQVHREVSLLHEGAAAVRAGERFLTCVAADVPHQRRPPAEALPADGAAERPLSRVDPHVRPQVPPQGEALPADAAAERRLSVNSQVKLQVVSVLQVFPTHAAVSRMCRGVGQKRTLPLEGLPAHFTSEPRWKLVRQIS